jgi:hypothetical protein
MSADEKPGGSWQPDGAASSFAAFGAASGFAFGQSASTPAFSSTAPSTAALAFGLGPPQHTAAPLAAPASAPALGFGEGPRFCSSLMQYDRLSIRPSAMIAFAATQSQVPHEPPLNRPRLLSDQIAEPFLSHETKHVCQHGRMGDRLHCGPL